MLDFDQDPSSSVPDADHAILAKRSRVFNSSSSSISVTSIMSSSNNVHIVNHPIVRSKLTACRTAGTSPKDFREAIRDISFIIGIEASRDLEEKTVKLQSPVNAFTGTEIKPRIGLTPILRAGLGMSDAMLSLFPKANVYHIGLFREKISLQPVEYYSKLPREPTVDLVYILDPLIATAGTAIAALNMIIDWGIPIKNIRYLAILASEQGLKNVLEEFPDLQIWVAAVDNVLTQNGLIDPGLGDAGDRLFNTLKSDL
ncbi:hypothetical protein FRC02_008508 [Tulasnella sp. 418]|nr:hypothetical protein FRC02_008508 [Tulasnella sp. 418]